MAKTVVGLEVTSNLDETAKSVGSLKQQLRQAQNEVAALSDKFGATSKEAIEAAKRAAKLKDAIGDAKNLTDAYNPDAKFRSFSQALSGVTSGFAALNGAQGLFGDKSEELEKTLLKVQSAMALSQGLNGLMEAKDSFINLGAIIKNNVVAAFGSLKAAIISTGIGALAIAIGYVISNFDKLKNSGGLVGKIFRGIGDAVGWIVDKLGDLTDWFGLTGDAEEDLSKRSSRAMERMEAAKQSAYDNELKLAKAVGKGVEQIEKKKRDEMMKTLEQQKLMFEVMRKVMGGAAPEWVDDVISQIDIKLQELKTDAKVAQIEQAKKVSDAAKKRQDELKKLFDDLDSEAIKRRASAWEIELFEIQKRYDERVKLAKNNSEILKQIELARMAEISEANIKNNKIEEDTVQKTEGKKLEITTLNNAALLQATVNHNEAKIQAKLDEFKMYQWTEEEKVRVVTDGLGQIADIVGKESAAGKALSIAQAVINTYEGATKSIAKGGFWGIAQAAITIAAGLANVKRIIATKLPGKAANTGGVPSISSAAVSAPIMPQAQTTTLNQAQINQIGNATVRAFIVDRDVENNRDRITRLNRAARIN